MVAARRALKLRVKTKKTSNSAKAVVNILNVTRPKIRRAKVKAQPGKLASFPAPGSVKVGPPPYAPVILLSGTRDDDAVDAALRAGVQRRAVTSTGAGLASTPLSAGGEASSTGGHSRLSMASLRGGPSPATSAVQMPVSTSLNPQSTGTHPGNDAAVQRLSRQSSPAGPDVDPMDALRGQTPPRHPGSAERYSALTPGGVVAPHTPAPRGSGDNDSIQSFDSTPDNERTARTARLRMQPVAQASTPDGVAIGRLYRAPSRIPPRSMSLRSETTAATDREELSRAADK